MARHGTTQPIERDKRWAEHWEEARVFGRWRFLWLRGVMGWGMPWAVLMLAWRWWNTGLQPPLPDILITAIIGIVGGIAFGAFTWWRAERRYQQWLASHSSTVAREFE